MSESETPESPDEQIDQLRHLRDLLVSPSMQDLEERLKDQVVSSEKLSDMLPEAIRISSSQNDRLAKSIQPIFSSAFSASVKRNPKALADAVSPIMGPAIQRYIKQQIQAMIQSLNTTLDQSLSAKSFRWRWESWRTGKPFAEIVLLHTLVYRIEQILLIDPETGLLMQSVSLRQQDDDADLVSSLLTAIQDFMRDSFRHRSDAGAELQDMKTNELTVWIHHGSEAVLAVAIRGQAPIAMREKIQRVLDQLHVEYRSLLANFSGDTSPMEILRPELEDLMQSEFVGKSNTTASEKNESEIAWWQKQLIWAIPAALLLLVGAGLYSNQQRAYRDYIARQLDLPPTTTLTINENTITLSGSAHHDELARCRNRFERLANLQLQLAENVSIIDQPWVDYIRELKSAPGITLLDARRDRDKHYLYGLKDPDAEDPNQILLGIPGLNVEDVISTWIVRKSTDPQMIKKRLESRMEGLSSFLQYRVNEKRGVLVISEQHDHNVPAEVAYMKIQELRDVVARSGLESGVDLSPLTSKYPAESMQ